MKRPRDSNIDVQSKGHVNRTRMTRIQRIDAYFFRLLSAPICWIRVIRVLLARTPT